MQKFYCDFCGTEVFPDQPETFEIPTIREGKIGKHELDDICLSCAEKIDDFLKALRTV